MVTIKLVGGISQKKVIGGIDYVGVGEIIEKKVVKRDNKWCVVHTHPPDVGKIIKCYSGKGAKEKAERMHRAIMAQRYKDLSNNELLRFLRHALVHESDDVIVDSFKELAIRKENNKINFVLKSKELPPTMYEVWKRIKKRLNDKEITLIILTPVGFELLEKTLIDSKALRFGYHSKAKPYYRFELPIIHEDLKSAGWNKKKLLIDIKADGLRISLVKINNECRIYVDPEELKRKSPDISNRLVGIIKEANDILPNGTVCDAEFYAAKGNEALHRTAANGLVNSKAPAEQIAKYCHLFVFDVLYYKGKDARDLPLQDRLKLLSKIKSSQHIKIEKYSSSLKSGYQGYAVDGGNKSDIDKAIKLITEGKHGLHMKLEEGVMFKTLEHPYEMRTNHGWGKAKRWHEVDTIAYDRKLVKSQTSVWNYFLGINISKDYYDKLPNKIKTDLNGKYYMRYGKSDNSKLNIKPSVSTVIRVASEEVNKFENEEFPEAPWYRGYVSIILEHIPEKNVSDTLDALERLSLFQPKRIPIEELARLKNITLPDKIKSIASTVRDMNSDRLIRLKDKLDISDSHENLLLKVIDYELKSRRPKTSNCEIEKATKLAKEEYKKIYKDYKLQPLPDRYYKSPRKGIFWAQMHIRGVTPEEYEDYKSGKIPLWKAIRNHSMHVDLRTSFGGLKRLFQLVLVEDSIDSYLRVMKGQTDPKTNQLSKGLIVIKPSTMEPSERVKEKKEMLLDETGAKKVADLIVEPKSYWIKPGEVGATKDKFAYMGTIVLGDVKSGTMRDDYKELFFYPKGKNTELWNGRFVVKAFKTPSLWWIFKTKEPYPSNPFCHVDKGNFILRKSENIKYYSKEEFPEWKTRKDFC